MSIGRRFADVTTVIYKAAKQGFIASGVSITVLQLLHFCQQCSKDATVPVLLAPARRSVTSRTARTTQLMPVMPLATVIVNFGRLASHPQQQQQIMPLAAVSRLSLFMAATQTMPVLSQAIAAFWTSAVLGSVAKTSLFVPMYIRLYACLL